MLQNYVNLILSIFASFYTLKTLYQALFFLISSKKSKKFFLFSIISNFVFFVFSIYSFIFYVFVIFFANINAKYFSSVRTSLIFVGIIFAAKLYLLILKNERE